jgi:Tfp pilus assembly protein PilP
MVASVAWGLLLLLAVVGLLRAADHEDRQKLDAVNRRIDRMMNDLQPTRDPAAPPQTAPDLTNRSRPTGNGPQIAK